jgi:hypothetical protein
LFHEGKFRSKEDCRLNEKAVEDQKAVKAAAELFNAPVVGRWYRKTKPRRSQEDIQ